MPRDGRWIRRWLRDWAEWYEGELGYPSDTVIARAIAGKLNEGAFHSALPKGIEPNRGYLLRLIHAMRIVSNDPKKFKYIRVVQLYYLLGPAETARLLRDRPQRTLRRWRNRGEKLLQDEIRATE